ncbi:hypothetical protein [Nostoc sp. PCC 7107]|uniref:hypothetical protein n=1 Tax=Nostoc sp. PCC 7107 TaxID=317936 RepID=UPI00029F4BB4|nr:hypothetical protein [Nostoc sp. PCC 7107]AFY43650.1 hypothetical protein Nos7107_3059 [Nostoc sp. PCC 7107]
MTEFNESLYKASMEALLTANVPRAIAEAASRVVASDQADQPNLGRTKEDQQAVNTAMQHYRSNQEDS